MYMPIAGRIYADFKADRAEVQLNNAISSHHSGIRSPLKYDTGCRLVSMYMAVLSSALRQNEPSCLRRTGLSLSRVWLTFGLSSVTLCYPPVLLSPSVRLKRQRRKEMCPIIFLCCVTAPSDRSITNRSTYVLTAAADCCSEDKGHYFLLVPLFCFEVKVSFKFVLVADFAIIWPVETNFRISFIIEQKRQS